MSGLESIQGYMGMECARGVVSALAVVGVMFAAPLRADEWNKKTLVTFDQAVEISGHVLVAGTYVFQLADSSSNRHIVRISNRDGRAVVATVLAIPNYRLPTTHGPVIAFDDAAIGSPQAIRAWFYPGSSIGQEFVYPKRRAIQVAKATDLVVLALAGDGPIDVNSVGALKQAPIVAIAPDATESPVVLNPTTAADDMSSCARERTAAARSRLPKAGAICR